jgi:hypothetical protein
MAAKNQTGCDCLLNQGPSGWANFQQLDSSTTIFLSVLTSRRKLCAYSQTQKSYKPCFLGLEILTWKPFLAKLKWSMLSCCVVLGSLWETISKLRPASESYLLHGEFKWKVPGQRNMQHAPWAALFHPVKSLSVFHPLGIYFPPLGYSVEVNKHIKIVI